MRSDRVIARGGDRDHLRAARPHLVDVVDHLREDRRARRHRDDRRALVEHRDRAVLHLAGRIGVGRDVGDLLELERSLEGDRHAGMTPDVEEEVRLPAPLGDRIDTRVEPVEQLVDELWQLAHRGDELADPRR